MAIVALDTNVWAYAAKVGQTQSDQVKCRIAEDLIRKVLREDLLIMPVQVALELHTVLIRKRGLSRGHARRIVESHMVGAVVVASDEQIALAGFSLAEQHGLQTFDAAILAAVANADCSVLYSEDMQHGFEWNGVLVINPFA